MPESKEKTALLPQPSPEVGSDNGEKARPRASDQQHKQASKKPFSLSVPTILRRGILLLSCAVTLLTGTVFVAQQVREKPLGRYFMTRLFLGDVFGGMDRVTFLEKDNLSLSITRPDEEQNGLLSETMTGLESVDQPTAADTSRTIYTTLSSSDTEFSNETPYEPNVPALLAAEPVIAPAEDLYAIYGEGAPLVLILHTHGTEGYRDCADTDYRTTDREKNVVSCGAIIAEELEKQGISVLHCTTLFDEEDFTMAYYNASLHIRSILEEYPSVAYILDVHRDSILSGDSYMAPFTETDPGKAAQMMFVVGTDYGGADHENWTNNLSLALRLQSRLNKNTPQLMRNINLRSASFNQQYSPGALLLEIGACGSSLEEAHQSAALFAQAFAEEIVGEELIP